ncbi:MAG TPA: hypothetical protein VF556_02250 [Pyrinomonadaceae bacterium]|jgi:hypothetical protein
MENSTITIKNELPELLEAVCNHADCPGWLQDVIWNGFNNRIDATGLSAHWFRYALGELKDSNENSPSKSEHKQAAEFISKLLDDPTLPEPIREAIAGGLVDMYNEHIDTTECNKHQQSTQYIEMILRGYAIKQGVE